MKEITIKYDCKEIKAQISEKKLETAAGTAEQISKEELGFTFKEIQNGK